MDVEHEKTKEDSKKTEKVIETETINYKKKTETNK